MQLKTLQWNIGGCKVRAGNADPTLIESYKIDGFEYIRSVIEEQNPHIVTLQETHENDEFSQVRELAEKLKYPYFFNDPYDTSHIDPAFKLGQAILSRFPLVDHTFEHYINPKLEMVRPNGEHWVSHDKGVSTCFAILNEDNKIEIKTTHLVPFLKFGKSFDNGDLQPILSDIDTKLCANYPSILLQGDFNFDNESLRGLLPQQFSNGSDEVKQAVPTTPKGRRYDHVVFRGLTLVDSLVLNDLYTDHYPIVSLFELPKKT